MIISHLPPYFFFFWCEVESMQAARKDFLDTKDNKTRLNLFIKPTLYKKYVAVIVSIRIVVLLGRFMGMSGFDPILLAAQKLSPYNGFSYWPKS